jgi:hypothetical protein
MATITVKRGDKRDGYSYVLKRSVAADNYALDVLRMELAEAKLIFPADAFLNKEKAIVSRANEGQQYLSELFRDEDVLIYDKEEPKKLLRTEKKIIPEVNIKPDMPDMISLVKGATKTAVTIDSLSETLASLRQRLQSGKKLMAMEDVFLFKGSAEIDKEDEAHTTIEVAAKPETDTAGNIVLRILTIQAKSQPVAGQEEEPWG